jgi:hypothetical protein
MLSSMEIAIEQPASTSCLKPVRAIFSGLVHPVMQWQA